MTPFDCGREAMPAALREAIRRELQPVAPLAAPSKRALLLALPALVLLSAALVVVGRANGWQSLSGVGAGVSALEWLTGFALLWLALREAVPGLGLGVSRTLAVLAGGILLQVLLGLVLWRWTGPSSSSAGALAAGSQCASIMGAIGLPHLAVATWLALRALPLRPRCSGALAGAAAGLLADSLWHLGCSRNDLEHLLVWHLGATVTMTLAGAVSGSIWPRRRRSR